MEGTDGGVSKTRSVTGVGDCVVLNEDEVLQCKRQGGRTLCEGGISTY